MNVASTSENTRSENMQLSLRWRQLTNFKNYQMFMYILSIINKNSIKNKYNKHKIRKAATKTMHTLLETNAVMIEANQLYLHIIFRGACGRFHLVLFFFGYFHFPILRSFRCSLSVFRLFFSLL